MGKEIEETIKLEDDKSLELSLEVLRHKLEIAQLSSTKIPAENVQKIVDAFVTVDGFLRRDDVKELFHKSNSSVYSKDLLTEASDTLDVLGLKRSERDTMLRIAAVAIAAGVAVSGLFGLF